MRPSAADRRAPSACTGSPRHRARGRRARPAGARLRDVLAGRDAAAAAHDVDLARRAVQAAVSVPRPPAGPRLLPRRLAVRGRPSQRRRRRAVDCAADALAAALPQRDGGGALVCAEVAGLGGEEEAATRATEQQGPVPVGVGNAVGRTRRRTTTAWSRLLREKVSTLHREWGADTKSTGAETVRRLTTNDLLLMFSCFPTPSIAALGAFVHMSASCCL